MFFILSLWFFFIEFLFISIRMLSPDFFMINDAYWCIFFAASFVVHFSISANTSLNLEWITESSSQIDDNLELSDVTMLLHQSQEFDDIFGSWCEQHLPLLSISCIYVVSQSVYINHPGLFLAFFLYQAFMCTFFTIFMHPW